MSLRNFILLIVLGTLLATAAWGIILLNVDPEEAGIPGLVMFYLTLGASLTGMMALLLSFLRIVIFRKHSIPSREIRLAFRHAVLFSIVAVGTLILSAQGWLQTWHIVALVALISLAEAVLGQLQRR